MLCIEAISGYSISVLVLHDLELIFRFSENLAWVCVFVHREMKRHRNDSMLEREN